MKQLKKLLPSRTASSRRGLSPHTREMLLGELVGAEYELEQAIEDFRAATVGLKRALRHRDGVRAALTEFDMREPGTPVDA